MHLQLQFSCAGYFKYCSNSITSFFLTNKCWRSSECSCVKKQHFASEIPIRASWSSVQAFPPTVPAGLSFFHRSVVHAGVAALNPKPRCDPHPTWSLCASEPFHGVAHCVGMLAKAVQKVQILDFATFANKPWRPPPPGPRRAVSVIILRSCDHQRVCQGQD